MLETDGTETISDMLTFEIPPVDLPVKPAITYVIDGDSITVTATSTSEQINIVGFYLDGQWGKNIGSAPYTWKFTGLSDGNHDIKVKLVENDGTKTWSDVETFTIESEESFEGPVWIAGHSIDGDSVTINADTSSDNVILIGFYVDGKWAKNIKEVPYTWTFTGLSSGEHEFKLKLVEADRKTYSETLTVTLP